MCCFVFISCLIILCNKVARNFSLKWVCIFCLSFIGSFCGSESVMRLFCHDSFVSLDLHSLHNVCKWVSMNSMVSCFAHKNCNFLHHSLRLLTAESASCKDRVRLQLGGQAVTSVVTRLRQPPWLHGKKQS